MTVKDVMEILEQYELKESKQIDQSKIKFQEEVRKMCEMNSCGRYGTNWQCPPGVGELEDLKNHCARFENAILLSTVKELEDSFDIEGMEEAGVNHREICLKIHRDIKERFHPEDYLVLSAGGCGICKRCAYLDGNPCIYKSEVLASMEAYGINVVELCSSTGVKYINGQNTVSYFGLILF